MDFDFEKEPCSPEPLEKYRSYYQAMAARGRDLVLAGCDGTNHGDFDCLREYWKVQRSVVESRGYCEGDCGSDETVGTASGEMVCRRTRRSCPALKWERLFLHWVKGGEDGDDNEGDAGCAGQETTAG